MKNNSDSNEHIELAQNGYGSQDFKVGINIREFNNTVNPYFVYRASIRDNLGYV